MRSLDVTERSWSNSDAEKCDFFTNCIYLPGHVIRLGCLTVESCTIDAICSLQAPSNITGLRSFIGLCSVFCCIVPNCARIAAPISRKSRKDQPHVYTKSSEEELEALRTLKEKLMSPPVLALLRSWGTNTVDTDACDRPIG